MKTIKSFMLLASMIFTLFTEMKAQGLVQKPDQLISQLKATIEAQQKEINYYKETLKLLQGKTEAEVEYVTFKINKIEGNKKDHTLTITGVYVSSTDLRSLQTQYSKMIDPQGNQFQSTEHELDPTNKSERVEDVFKDIPLKFKITFNGITEEFPVIKVLTIYVYNDTPRVPFAKFENLNVNWQ